MSRRKPLLDKRVIENLHATAEMGRTTARWDVVGDPVNGSTVQLRDGSVGYSVTLDAGTYTVHRVWSETYRKELFKLTDRALLTRWLLWKTSTNKRMNLGLRWCRIILAPGTLPDRTTITQTEPGVLTLSYPVERTATGPIDGFEALFELALLSSLFTWEVARALRSEHGLPFFCEWNTPGVPEGSWGKSPDEWDDFEPWLNRATAPATGDPISAEALAILDEYAVTHFHRSGPLVRDGAVWFGHVGMDTYRVRYRNGIIQALQAGERQNDRVIFRTNSQHAADVHVALLCLPGRYGNLPLPADVTLTEVDHGRLLRLEWPGGWAEAPNDPDYRWLPRMAPYITMTLDQIRQQKKENSV
ncbi:hypothetical protein [Leifsonia sp. Leaf264]|uniref:hypothetical protein n=1 Tax=Leifsonia sp. Leaf264 TaxID=1736314 RepID=UPI0006F75A6C|nr:hypothetical protein [Leifsonia sp. Leaf264]KQO98424.1 hypothetical protein ASF30_10205 [Leifsonia sp. Leaf264]